MPSGGRVSGTTGIYKCEAPNPGFATAPLLMSLLIGKRNDPRTMVQHPLSADAPVRQLRPQ